MVYFFFLHGYIARGKRNRLHPHVSPFKKGSDINHCQPLLTIITMACTFGYYGYNLWLMIMVNLAFRLLTLGYSQGESILWPPRMAQEAGFGREEQMEEEVLTEDEEIRDPGH